VGETAEVVGSGRTLSQLAGSGTGRGGQAVGLAAAAGVRREVFGCGRWGSSVRCVGLPGSAGGGGQTGGASGC
jgi:hypothetical protein